MSELLLVLLILFAAVLLPWIGTWDPETLLWSITGILNLMNIGMTAVNLSQAFRRNPRFLDARVLGVVQVALGVALLGAFLPTLGPRPETWFCAMPFLAGGVLVLVARR
ncbi:MAG: hypothetical protein ACLFRP_09535 [Puniceicoccaceae bacterium]